MAVTKNQDITTSHILVVLSLMAFTMALFFAFQMSQVVMERDFLHQTKGQQRALFEQSQKLNEQFGGLVVGTQKLAKEGDKDAQSLIDRLKQIGVIQTSPHGEGGLPPAPVPAATEKAPPGPVKP